MLKVKVLIHILLNSVSNNLSFCFYKDPIIIPLHQKRFFTKRAVFLLFEMQEMR
ncbi:hypothetical protein BACINT_00753 [Bacteroides intestinalis DSM 17393]|uniref:Uncharacterized protein n=1 Tax=Bacteroides intestinalis DSM 17393 TaxID=471870 RepID=B3C764_9BACE|nr:hypothetical protein BACINT_00753 [Bacteroides intestinalis DSM 17393]